MTIKIGDTVEITNYANGSQPELNNLRGTVVNIRSYSAFPYRVNLDNPPPKSSNPIPCTEAELILLSGNAPAINELEKAVEPKESFDKLLDSFK